MLPFTGLAASGLAGECPMQQSAAKQDADGMAHAMPGCDSMQPSQGGKPSKAGFCKMTAQCGFGSLYYSGSGAGVIRRSLPASSRIVFHYSQSLSIRAPDGLWRPPRSL
ncbi:hypothetical protein [Paraburkholderia sp. ZP32-5]|uniref:hypothetical protein n=1 Tax=Paraburkholderia sp. ZP32-5 TaxID=2883245 RepID=UPI002DD4406A|nr:hypothetical protein [Paraburkholderia sp. ZP32-5]